MENVYYINLKHRTDRNEQIKLQLNKLGWKYTRFNAIKMKNGRVGCSMSHLKLLQLAKEQQLEYIVILEDDVLFKNINYFKKQLSTFLNSSIDYDVLLLAGNNVPPYEKINDYCIKVGHCQTTTGYIVREHYYDTLINNIKQGIILLMKHPQAHYKYAIDKYWINLQKINNWYLIIPITVTQKADYSDIEKRNVNYENLMLSVDKPWLSK